MLQSWGDSSPCRPDGLPLPPHKKRRVRRQTDLSPIAPIVVPSATRGGGGHGHAHAHAQGPPESGGLLYAYRDGSPSGDGESDEEDPNPAPGRSNAARAHRGTLYGRLWFTPPDGGSVVESAGFAAGSALLNLALVLFLIWTRAEPRCADAWLPLPPVPSGVLVTPTATPLPDTLPIFDEATAPAPVPMPAQPLPLPLAEQPLDLDLPPLTPEEIDAPVADPHGPAASPSPPSKVDAAPSGPALASASESESKPGPADPASNPAAAIAHLSGEEYNQALMRLQQQQAIQMEKEAQGREANKQNGDTPASTPAATPAPTPTPAPEPAPASTPPPAAKTTPATAAPTKPFAVVPVPAGVAMAASASPKDVDAFQRDFRVDSDHHFTWQACPAALELREGVDYATDALIAAPPRRMCPETAKCEQAYQLSWFGRHLAPKGKPAKRGDAVQTELRRYVPRFLDCVHAPPDGYKWPEKHAQLPCHSKLGAVHWPNLRVSKREELVQFNEGTPKNLFHFDAAEYDRDGFAELSLAARHIPLLSKVRLALDLGAGGGSLGLLLGRAYNVTTVATAFADWPYCEYLSERGQLCLLLDSMEPMPFAKGSFDLVHSSWLHHGQRPAELADFLYEADRVLRPGGYLHLRGGWSNAQIAKQRSMLAALGYALLYEQVAAKPREVTARVSFGEGLPYEADWTAIYVKPVRAVKAEEGECKERVRKERNGKLVLPLKARPVPSQMGNQFENEQA